jgi:hypothetical protein
MTKRRQFCPQAHDTFVVGRDQSSRCLECKRLGLQANWAARRAEEEAAREAERAQKRAAEEKRRRAERARILKAGGDEAKDLLWDEAFTESLSSGGPGLCQWQDEVDGRYQPRQCFQPATDSSTCCARHDRELEEGIAKRKAELAQPAPPNAPSMEPEPEPDPELPQVVSVERPALRSVTAWGERGWFG